MTFMILARDLTSDHALVTSVHGEYPVAITGDVKMSSVMSGTIAVETEIGTVYLPEDEEVAVIENP